MKNNFTISYHWFFNNMPFIISWGIDSNQSKLVFSSILFTGLESMETWLKTLRLTKTYIWQNVPLSVSHSLKIAFGAFNENCSAHDSVGVWPSLVTRLSRYSLASSF